MTRRCGEGSVMPEPTIRYTAGPMTIEVGPQREDGRWPWRVSVQGIGGTAGSAVTLREAKGAALVEVERRVEAYFSHHHNTTNRRNSAPA
jgi:hypothetical protein